jgi:hypothetical protein
MTASLGLLGSTNRSGFVRTCYMSGLTTVHRSSTHSASSHYALFHCRSKAVSLWLILSPPSTSLAYRTSCHVIFTRLAEILLSVTCAIIARLCPLGSFEKFNGANNHALGELSLELPRISDQPPSADNMNPEYAGQMLNQSIASLGISIHYSMAAQNIE